MALNIAGTESKLKGSTSTGKIGDVATLIGLDPEAIDSESSSSLSDRGVAMLNAPKMSRRKVKAGSARKTGGISREATVPVKPQTGPML